MSSKVWVWVCPVCGKKIVGIHPNQTRFNAVQHLKTHNVRRKIRKDELVEVEVR